MKLQRKLQKAHNHIVKAIQRLGEVAELVEGDQKKFDLANLQGALEQVNHTVVVVAKKEGVTLKRKD